MYNAFKHRKDKAEDERVARQPKPLKDHDPKKAQQKMDRLFNNAKTRRETWIHKIDFGAEDKFLILNNGGNDSIKFRTENFDFRGEKGRNKSLDISGSRFNCSTFKTNEQRV